MARIQKATNERGDAPIFVVEVDHYVEDVDKHEMFGNLRFIRHSGTRGEKLVPRGDLAVPSKIKAVLDPQGVNYLQADLARVCAAHEIDTDKVKYCYSSPGWRDGKFGFPGRKIHEAGLDLTMLPVDEHSALAAFQQRAGTVQSWMSEVSRGFETSSYALFAFGLVCAAPLLRFSKAPEGAIFAFSGLSGVGKTTICAAAQAIMGNPARNLLPTWDGTDAGFKDLLSDTRDSLVILDDTSKGKMTARERLDSWEHIAHAVSGGGKRTRARSHDAQHGAPMVRRPALALTGGEVSPEELAFLMGQKIKGGAWVRFIDIPLPLRSEGGAFDLILKEGLGGETVETAHMAVTWLAQVISETHGVAFPVLLDHLEGQYEDLEIRVPKIEAAFVENAMKGRGGEPDGSERRMALKFGLAFVGLTMAIEAGILEINSKRARRAVMVCFNAAMRSEDERRNERPRQIRQLRRLFRNISQTRFVYKSQLPSPKFTAFRRLRKGAEFAFIRFDRIGPALSIGDNEVRALMADLASQNHLAPGTGRDRTRPITMSDGSQVRHYAFPKAFYAKPEKGKVAAKKVGKRPKRPAKPG